MSVRTDPPKYASVVTSPLSDTVAMVALLDDQVIGRSVTVIPVESLALATSRVVRPAVTATLSGVTTMRLTGSGVTVSRATALLPSLDAVIVSVRVDPPRYAKVVTSPLSDTVAMVALLDDQITARAVNVTPAESLMKTTSRVVSPAATMTLSGVRRMRLTAAGSTEIVAVPLTPSLEADSTTGRGVPLVTTPAVTTPSALTVASVASDVLHVTERPLSVLPCAFWMDAVKVMVARL